MSGAAHVGQRRFVGVGRMQYVQNFLRERMQSLGWNVTEVRKHMLSGGLDGVS